MRRHERHLHTIIRQAELDGWRAECCLVLIHAGAGEVRFVDTKPDSDGPGLHPELATLRRDLIRAGAKHHVVRVPSGIGEFVNDLREIATSKLAARRR